MLGRTAHERETAMGVPITRRHLLTGTAALGLVGRISPSRAVRSTLNLRVAPRPLAIDGNEVLSALGFQTGDQFVRVARFTLGDRFAVTLENRIDEPTLIHWHGLTPPSPQDG